jgi:predicted ATPase/DNA-binding XRE family transcriptional regulator
MNETFAFGNRLRQLRAQHDLTQESLAEAVGCATQTIRAFESGRRRPSRAMAERLAQILQVPEGETAIFLRLARILPSEHMPAEDKPPTIAPPIHVPPQQLPLPPDTLIGRSSELARLKQLLINDKQRLITLLGPGGMGKTRLALQVAADLSVAFADGIAFVALAALIDATNIAATIAKAINCPLSSEQSPLDALLLFLRERRMLLVLDNLEQLLGPQSANLNTILTDILQQAHGIQILTTSRERLRLRGEYAVELGGLRLPNVVDPPERSEALLLFIERARQIDDQFVLGPENRDAVVRICQLVDGAPLGIELAASWVRVLSCADIATEIQRNLDLLALSDRNLPERHRSLQAVMNHSWQLLSTAEQHFFMHISIFRGGFTRAAAEAMLAHQPKPTHHSTLQLLASLVDKSLLRRTPNAGNTRYDLHELVRQYATIRFATNSTLQAQAETTHAEYYVALLQQEYANLTSTAHLQTRQMLFSEIDNLRQAWEYAVAQQRIDLLRHMSRPFQELLEMLGWLHEGLQLHTTALAALRPNQHPAQAFNTTLGYLKSGHGLFLILHNQITTANTVLHEALTLLANDEAALAETGVLLWLAMTEMQMGRTTPAEVNLQRGLDLSRAYHHLHNQGVAELYLGINAYVQGNFAEAAARFTNNLTFWRTYHHQRGLIICLASAAEVQLAVGNIEQAALMADELLHTSRTVGDRWGIAVAYSWQGEVALERDNATQAAALLAQSVSLFRELKDPWGISTRLVRLTRALIVQRDLEAARRTLSEVTHMAHTTQIGSLSASVAIEAAHLQAAEGYYAEALTALLTLQATQPETLRFFERPLSKLRQWIEHQLGPERSATIIAKVQQSNERS